MLDLTSWKDRIDTTDAPARLAADIEAAQDSSRLPLVTLVPGREVVQSAPLSGGARHRVVAEVLVISGVRRGNKAQAGMNVDALAGVRQPVLQQLINWTPPGSDIAVAWQGGRILKLSSHALFWVDAFTTDYWWNS